MKRLDITGKSPNVLALVFVVGFVLGVAAISRLAPSAPPPGPVPAPTVPNAVAPGVPFRIMTFNVELFAAPGVTVTSKVAPKFADDAGRLGQAERIAGVIEALRPDVLNLCEVMSREGIELLVRILHEKGLTEYQGYHVENHDTATGEDVCFLSRYTPDVIDGAAIRSIFSRSNDSPWRQPYTVSERGRTENKTASVSRNAVYYFTINGKKLGFCGLHLKAIPDDPPSNAQRDAQAIVCQRMIEAEITARGYWPIVLGDLNDYDADLDDADPKRSTQTQVLARLKDFAVSHPGNELMNVMEKAPRVADRWTSYWDKNGNQKVDPGDVHSMIDHILVPVEWAGAIDRAFVAHVVPGDTTDHSPVVVDLDLAKIPSDAPPVSKP